MHLLWICGYKFPLKRFCRFLFSGACNLLLPLVSVCFTVGPLELQQAVLLFSVLSKPQAFRLCQVSSVLWNRSYRNQTLWCLPENLGHWTHTSTLSFLREKPGVWDFLLILHWAVEKGNGEWVGTSSNHCLCSQLPPSWCSYLSVLRFRQDRTQSFW